MTSFWPFYSHTLSFLFILQMISSKHKCHLVGSVLFNKIIIIIIQVSNFKIFYQNNKMTTKMKFYWRILLFFFSADHRFVFVFLNDFFSDICFVVVETNWTESNWIKFYCFFSSYLYFGAFTQKIMEKESEKILWYNFLNR